MTFNNVKSQIKQALPRRVRARLSKWKHNLDSTAPSKEKQLGGNAPTKTTRFIECSFQSEREKFLPLLGQALSSDVQCFKGGGDRRHRVRLNFLREQMKDVIQRLVEVLDAWGGDFHFRTDRGRIFDIEVLKGRAKKKAFLWIDLRLEEVSVSQPRLKTIYFSVVELEFWKAPPNSYKVDVPLTCPRGNQLIHPIRAKTFDLICDASVNKIGDDSPSTGGLSEITNSSDHQFPIDVVYTWVDDQDENWLAQKLEAQSGASTLGAGSRALLSERFTNRNELMYSLRSLELNAPFVRHIYLVTAGQRPKWLVDDHPRLTVVDHRDIYANPDCLPVFNSSSIETQLHHIEGLSEHFLYMNDDFFFGKVCEADDFFLSNGLARLPYSDSRINKLDIDDTSEEYIIADKNALELFATHLGFEASPLLIHSPYPARVSILNEMENLFSEEFKRCERQKFRSKEDLRPIAFMFPQLSYQRGLAVPYNISNRYLALWKPSIKEQMANVLKSRRYKTFCINDVGLSDDNRADIDAAVLKFLKSFYPYKSSFEKKV